MSLFAWQKSDVLMDALTNDWNHCVSSSCFQPIIQTVNTRQCWWSCWGIFILTFVSILKTLDTTFNIHIQFSLQCYIWLLRAHLVNMVTFNLATFNLAQTRLNYKKRCLSGAGSYHVLSHTQTFSSTNKICLNQEMFVNHLSPNFLAYRQKNRRTEGWKITNFIYAI